MKSQVLIIDDDIDICQLLQKLFEDKGFICFYATSHKEALQFIEYIKFQVLVIDYMMPEKNGIEAIEDFKLRNINIPSLMLTAVSDQENVIAALKAGAFDYLTKPFNSEELILRVNKLISLYNRNNPSLNLKNSDIVTVDTLSFNLRNKKLFINNNEVALSNLEENLCYIFFNNINKSLEKEEIIEHLNKKVTISNLQSLNVSIMRLRKKIDPQGKYLKTLRNKGYILSS